MAVDNNDLDVIRQELEDDGRVDVSRVQVLPDADGVTLRGVVSNVVEADAAALIAQRHASHVRNELRVDEGVRERTTVPETGFAEGGAPDDALDASAAAAGRDEDVEEDLTTELQHALNENESWFPPDTPVSAPTVEEQRGIVETGEPELDVGDGDGTPSAADLSAEDLRRTALGERAGAPRDAEGS